MAPVAFMYASKSRFTYWEEWTTYQTNFYFFFSSPIFLLTIYDNSSSWTLFIIECTCTHVRDIAAMRVVSEAVRTRVQTLVVPPDLMMKMTKGGEKRERKEKKSREREKTKLEVRRRSKGNEIEETYHIQGVQNSKDTWGEKFVHRTLVHRWNWFIPKKL